MGNSYSNDFEDPVQLNYSYEFPEPLKPPLAYNFTDSEKQKMKDNHQITQNEIEDMEVADDCSKDTNHACGSGKFCDIRYNKCRKIPSSDDTYGHSDDVIDRINQEWERVDLEDEYVQVNTVRKNRNFPGPAMVKINGELISGNKKDIQLLINYYLTQKMSQESRKEIESSVKVITDCSKDQKQLELLEENITNITSEMQGEKEKNKTLQEKYNKIESEFTTIREQRDMIQQELNQLQIESKKNIEEKISEISNLKNSMGEVEKLAELEQMIEQKTRLLEEKTGQLSQKQEEYNKILAEIDQVRSAMAAQNTEFDEKEKLIDELNRKIDELQERNKVLNDGNDELDKNVRELESKQKDLLKNVSDIESRQDVQQRSFDQQKEELDNILSKIKSINSNRVTFKKQLTDKLEDVDKRISDKYKDLCKEINDTKDKCEIETIKQIESDNLEEIEQLKKIVSDDYKKIEGEDSSEIGEMLEAYNNVVFNQNLITILENFDTNVKRYIEKCLEKNTKFDEKISEEERLREEERRQKEAADLAAIAEQEAQLTVIKDKLKDELNQVIVSRESVYQANVRDFKKILEDSESIYKKHRKEYSYGMNSTEISEQIRNLEAEISNKNEKIVDKQGIIEDLQRAINKLDFNNDQHRENEASKKAIIASIQEIYNNYFGDDSEHVTEMKENYIKKWNESKEESKIKMIKNIDNLMDSDGEDELRGTISDFTVSFYTSYDGDVDILSKMHQLIENTFKPKLEELQQLDRNIDVLQEIIKRDEEKKNKNNDLTQERDKEQSLKIEIEEELKKNRAELATLQQQQEGILFREQREREASAEIKKQQDPIVNLIERYDDGDKQINLEELGNIFAKLDDTTSIFKGQKPRKIVEMYFNSKRNKGEITFDVAENKKRNVINGDESIPAKDLANFIKNRINDRQDADKKLKRGRKKSTGRKKGSGWNPPVPPPNVGVRQ